MDPPRDASGRYAVRRPSNAESDKDSSRFDVSSAFGVDVEPEGAGAARGRELGERQDADGAVQFKINSPTEDGSRSGTPRVEGPREVPTEYQPLDGSDPDAGYELPTHSLWRKAERMEQELKRLREVIALKGRGGAGDERIHAAEHPSLEALPRDASPAAEPKVEVGQESWVEAMDRREGAGRAVRQFRAPGPDREERLFKLVETLCEKIGDDRKTETKESDRERAGGTRINKNPPKFPTLAEGGNLQTYNDWVTGLRTYVRGTWPKHGPPMLEKVLTLCNEHHDDWVDADEDSREQIIPVLRKSNLSEMEHEAHGFLCSDIASHLPLSVQAYAHALATQRGKPPTLVDYVFRTLCIYLPASAKAGDKVRDAMEGAVKDADRPSRDALAGWLRAWKSQLTRLESMGVYDAGDNYSKLLSRLTSVVGSGQSEEFRFGLHTWKQTNRTPVKRVTQLYAHAYYTKVLGLADNCYADLEPKAKKEANLTEKEKKEKAKKDKKEKAKKQKEKETREANVTEGKGNPDLAAEVARLTSEVNALKGVAPPKGGGAPPKGAGKGADPAGKGTRGPLPCKFGKDCKRENCKFEHDPKLIAECKKRPCNQWKSNGKCTWGKMCVFAHASGLVHTAGAGLGSTVAGTECSEGKNMYSDTNMTFTTGGKEDEFWGLYDPAAQSTVVGSRDGTRACRGVESTRVQTVAGQVSADSVTAKTPAGVLPALYIPGARNLLAHATLKEKGWFGFSWFNGTVPENLVASTPAVYDERGEPHPLVEVEGLAAVPKRLATRGSNRLVTGAEKQVQHASGVMPFVGERLPCWRCGGVDHWKTNCVAPYSCCSDTVADLPPGVWEWADMPQRSRNILVRALRKAGIQGSPKYYWSNTGANTLGDVPSSGTFAAWDLDVDADWNVLLVVKVSGDQSQPTPLRRIIRVFYETETSKQYGGFSNEQGQVECDEPRAPRVRFASEVQSYYAAMAQVSNVETTAVARARRGHGGEQAGPGKRVPDPRPEWEPPRCSCRKCGDSDGCLCDVDSGTQFGDRCSVCNAGDPHVQCLCTCTDTLGPSTEVHVGEHGEDGLDPWVEKEQVQAGHRRHVKREARRSHEKRWTESREPSAKEEERGTRKRARKERRVAAIQEARKLEKLLGTELAHRALGHRLIYCPGCVTCALAKQKRARHKHEGLSRNRGSTHWHSDIAGPFPAGYDGSKYFIDVIAESEKEDECPTVRWYPMKSRHSGVVKNALESFARLIKVRPKNLRVDGANDYKGCVKSWVEKECSPPGEPPAVLDPTYRYSPWENGAAETNIGVGQAGVRAALLDSNAPVVMWPFALRWTSDTELLTSGAWERLYGVEAADTMRKNVAPFGALVTVVKEEPEIDGKTFEARALKAFLAGYETDGGLYVGFWHGGRWRALRTRNFRLFKDKKYWEEPPADTLEFVPSEGSTEEEASPDDHTVTWVECSHCGKWREVGPNEAGAIGELEVVSCEMMGLDCAEAQDPRAFTESEVHFSFNVGAGSENDLTGEPDNEGRWKIEFDFDEAEPDSVLINLFEAVARKLAFSDQEYTGGKTYKEYFQAAMKKELDMYVKHGALDMEGVIEQGDRSIPAGSLYARLNIIYGWKNAEKPDRSEHVEKARMVGCREWDRYGQAADGIGIEEVLWSACPSYDTVRLFIVLGALQKKGMTIVDWPAAYLGAVLGGPQVYGILPREAWPKEWEGKFKRPMVPIKGAVYGLKRAGHDYNKKADTVYHKRKWVSARKWDADPCVYVRPPLKGTAKAPDAIARWTDDNFLMAECGTEDTILDELGKDFPHDVSARMKLPQKYVGIDTSVENINEYLRKITFKQSLYVRGIVQEFKEEYSNHYKDKKLRQKDTPLPAGATREELLAACSAKVPEAPGERTESAGTGASSADAAPPKGKFASSCRKYIGALNFVQRCTRGDLAFSISVLSSVLDRWSEEADAYLVHLFGYLDRYPDLELVAWVDVRDLENGSIRLVLKTDASFAPGVSSKGTSGWLLYLVGARTVALIGWGSSKQKVESLHTAEAELHALCTGTRALIRIGGLADVLMGVGSDADVKSGEVAERPEGALPEELEIDASATEKALKLGFSEKFGHTRRTHRISLNWAHRFWQDKRVTLMSGKAFVPDAMTKSLPGEATQRYVGDMCLREPTQLA